jgi:glycosyltransferase involved in cell wall biosynthesis
MTRKITPFRDLASLFGLIKVIRRFRPDIVHTHTPKAGLLGMLAAWICRVPVRMHTVAGLPLMETSGFLQRLLIFTEQITYACATGVYPNSSGLKQYIQENITTKSMRMIGRGSSNGIDTTFFKPTPELEAAAQHLRNKYHITDKDVVFSFVGRLVKNKGIGELVKAFKKLATYSGRPGEGKIFLLLVGPFEQELDPLDAEDYKFLHENPQIVLAGFQSDVRPWIMASDIFVFPSYREGFPNVVMQASCLEVACVVSDINGCNEIIRHESTGLIGKPKD